jgi:hypothetical protein
MRREELIEKIREATVDNRLSCERAHELARELGVGLSEIGAACNELNVRISACQLGCF